MEWNEQVFVILFQFLNWGVEDDRSDLKNAKNEINKKFTTIAVNLSHKKNTLW